MYASDLGLAKFLPYTHSSERHLLISACSVCFQEEKCCLLSFRDNDNDLDKGRRAEINLICTNINVFHVDINSESHALNEEYHICCVVHKITSSVHTQGAVLVCYQSARIMTIDTNSNIVE